MRCFAVSRPANHAASLSVSLPSFLPPPLNVLLILAPQGFLASEGIAEAFRSQSVAVTNPENSSRTFYMIAPSNQERTAWVEAIQHNLQSYRVSISCINLLVLYCLVHPSFLQRSPQALEVACKELKHMLQAVGSELPSSSLPSVLLLLHQKKSDISHRTHSYCQSHHHHKH